MSGTGVDMQTSGLLRATAIQAGYIISDAWDLTGNSGIFCMYFCAIVRSIRLNVYLLLLYSTVSIWTGRLLVQGGEWLPPRDLLSHQVDPSFGLIFNSIYPICIEHLSEFAFFDSWVCLPSLLPRWLAPPWFKNTRLLLRQPSPSTTSPQPSFRTYK